MLAYIVRDATPGAGNADFAVYDGGTVRHIGGIEAGKLLDGSALGGTKPQLIAEQDLTALVNLYRDSATYVRPPYWKPEYDRPPYKYS